MRIRTVKNSPAPPTRTRTPSLPLDASRRQTTHLRRWGFRDVDGDELGSPFKLEHTSTFGRLRRHEQIMSTTQPLFNACET